MKMIRLKKIAGLTIAILMIMFAFIPVEANDFAGSLDSQAILNAASGVSPKKVKARQGTHTRRAAAKTTSGDSANYSDSIKSSDMELQNNHDVIIEITTSLGPVKVLLYGDTPAHQANFLKHAKEGYYNGVLFHRVIKDFMVQTGDPDSKNVVPGQQLGTGDPGYTLAAEIDYPKHYHKYGALAAARTGDSVNPERRSSGSQFYIVTGQKYDERTLKQIEERMANDVKQKEWMRLNKENAAKIKELRAAGDSTALEALREDLIRQMESNVKIPALPEQMKKDYIEKGGTPHLDNQYTVFGEVLEGMDVVEKIQNQSTDSSDRPKEDVRIESIKILSE